MFVSPASRNVNFETKHLTLHHSTKPQTYDPATGCLNVNIQRAPSTSCSIAWLTIEIQTLTGVTWASRTAGWNSHCANWYCRTHNLRWRQLWLHVINSEHINNWEHGFNLTHLAEKPVQRGLRQNFCQLCTVGIIFLYTHTTRHLSLANPGDQIKHLTVLIHTHKHTVTHSHTHTDSG